MPKKADPEHLQLSIMYAENLLRPESWIEKAAELLEAAHLLEERLVRFWEAVSPGAELPPNKVLQWPWPQRAPNFV